MTSALPYLAAYRFRGHHVRARCDESSFLRNLHDGRYTFFQCQQKAACRQWTARCIPISRFLGVNDRLRMPARFTQNHGTNVP